MEKGKEERERNIEGNGQEDEGEYNMILGRNRRTGKKGGRGIEGKMRKKNISKI